MISTEKTSILYNYIALYVKKQYRGSISKKMQYISDEFNYFNKSVCLFLSKLLSGIEIIFNFILPLTVIFYPVNFKYIAVSILFIMYLIKMKEFRLKNPRTYFHKLFIKEAVFQFYGIIIICFNLIIILDIKAIITLFLILPISCIKVINISVPFLYFYGFIYLLMTAIILKVYIKFIIVIALFLLLICLFYLYKKKISVNKYYNVELYKFFIFSINIRRLIRKLFKTPKQIVSFIFPYYIVLYYLVCFIMNKIPFIINGDIIPIIQIYIYFLVYYGYIKLRILTYDDCFYFSSTKLEFFKINIFLIYSQKILELMIFSVFAVFWGTICLIFITDLRFNFQTVFFMGITHILILFVCLSANVYVDKIKLEVTKQPEDLRRYMSFIEGLFISSILVIISLYMNLNFRGDIPSNILTILVNMDTAINLLQLVVWIGAIFSIIKTLNYMLIVKLNIKRHKVLPHALIFKELDSLDPEKLKKGTNYEIQ